MAELKIIKPDQSNPDLTDDQVSVLLSIFDHYDGAMSNEVILNYTIHGHIARMNKLGGRFVPTLRFNPGRFDREDMAVFSQPGVRWVEVANGFINVGL